MTEPRYSRHDMVTYFVAGCLSDMMADSNPPRHPIDWVTEAKFLLDAIDLVRSTLDQHH